MIPHAIIEFLGRASVGVASTRDEQMIPHLHFLSGWSVDKSRDSVTCLVPAAFDDGMTERLARCGSMSMVAEVIGPHETYQLKGRYIGHRPAGELDQPVYEACRGRFVEAVQRHLAGRFSDDTLQARIRQPAIAVRFTAEEIYIQTPGPAAGRRVFPSS